MTLKRYCSATLGVAASASSVLLLAPGLAGAQQSASAQALLEEIVVTARRREESLQDLPLSIAAISADQMAAQGIMSIEDIGDFVPNVTLTTSDRANNTRVVIRGIGGGHPDPVFVFGSGMYIDGHYIPNSLGGYMSTMDIERVELLRGPQGTLFGKNVTGGAVNIISAKPGPEFDSSINLRIAEDGDENLRGMINFPISETVYARLGAAVEGYDGHYYNRHLNIDTSGKDATTLNGALRWQPGNWTLDANAFMIRREDDNQGIQCNPFDGSAEQWGGGAGNIERLYPGAKQDYYDQCAADAAQGPFVNSSNKVTFSDLDQDSVFLSAQWDSDGPVGGLDSLTFRSSASYRENHYEYLQDRDASFLNIDAVGTFAAQGIGQDNWTRGAEFLVEAQASDRLEFTVGVNYFYEKAKNGDGRCREIWVGDPGNIEVLLDANGAPILDGDGNIQPVNPGRSIDCANGSGLYFDLLPDPRVAGGSPAFMNQERVENESIGVFGHMTYALSDNWDLDLGARWTEDDRNFWNMEGPNWLNGCDSGVAVPGQQTFGQPGTTGIQNVMCNTDGILLVDFGNTVQGGLFNEGAETFDEITPMISLTRNLAGGDRLESGMVYILYSEGFLTGGFNTELNANLPSVSDLQAYEPENVKNYEIGFKGTFAGGNLTLMADVFMMDYTNKQDMIDIPNPDLQFGIDDPLGVVQNVSSVDITGMEVELRASPWSGGFVSLDVGLLNNEYGEYSYPNPANPGETIDNTNTEITDLTADWTVNVGIEHSFMMGNGAALTPRLNIYSSDGIEYGEGVPLGVESPCFQDSYTKMGARLSYVPQAGNWRATLFGDNITDEEVYASCGNSRGVYRYYHERPAYWGVEFNMRWGASTN